MLSYGFASSLVNLLTRSHENPIEGNDLKFQIVASYLARNLCFWSIFPKTCSTIIPLAPRGSFPCCSEPTAAVLGVYSSVSVDPSNDLLNHAGPRPLCLGGCRSR